MQIQAQNTVRTNDLASIKREVGNTPLLFLESLSTATVKVFAKCEWEQIGKSVKARAAFGIIEHAITTGEWQEGMHLLDASSGNTAIADASIAQRLRRPVTICLPSNATRERKDTLKALGAELILTSPLEGTEGAQAEARKLKSEHPERFYYADQYGNANNWKAHYNNTAEEIFMQTKGAITHFIAGLGTTGTFCGTAGKLKALNPNIETIALQPDSPMHGLEGWKHLETAGAPAIYTDVDQDQVREVSTSDAYSMIKQIAVEEQLFISPSSAANLVGAATLASELSFGTIVTILPDSIERYGEIQQSIL